MEKSVWILKRHTIELTEFQNEALFLVFHCLLCFRTMMWPFFWSPPTRKEKQQAMGTYSK